MAEQGTETRPNEIPAQPPLSLASETAARFGDTITQPQETGQPQQEDFFVGRYRTKEEAAKAFEEKDRLIGEHGQKLGQSALELQRLRDENARLLVRFAQPPPIPEIAEAEPEYGDFYADPIGVLKAQGEHMTKKFSASMRNEIQRAMDAQNIRNQIIADFVNKQIDLHPYETYVRETTDQLQAQGMQDRIAAYNIAVRDVRSRVQQSQAQYQQPQYQQPQYQQPQYQQPQYQPQQIPNLMPSQHAAMPPQLDLSPSPRQFQEQTGKFRMEMLKKRTDGSMGFQG